MLDTIQPVPGSETSVRPPEAAEPRWNAWLALLTVGILPDTTARRTNHVGLGRAFAVHLSTAILAVVLIFFLMGWDETRTRPRRVTAILAEMTNQIGWFVDEFDRDPRTMGLATGATAVAIELGFLGLALALMPWGARDERVRESFRNALRRTWLHTPHALPLILIFGVEMVLIVHAQWEWWETNQIESPEQPAVPTGATPGTPEWDEYMAAVDEYQTASALVWQQRQATRPWYVRYGDVMLVHSFILLGTWWLWGQFRAAAADRRAVPVVRPPTCEWCGYNLTHAPMGGRCSECGHPVAESLGPDVRPGVMWERRRHEGWWEAWWQCTVDSMLRPVGFGRQLQVVRPVRVHGRFLAMHLLAIFVIAWVGILAIVAVASGRNPFELEGEIVWTAGPMTAFVTIVVVLFVAALTAAAAGVGYRLTDKRNLLPAAVQAASYLGFYLLLWSLLAAVAGLIVVSSEELFRAQERALGVPHELIQFAVWALSNVICLVLYGWLVARITAGARYANT